MENIYRRGGRTIFAFRLKLPDYLAQPSLQLLIREIGIRRTDYLHFPQFRNGTTAPVVADQRQFKELRINAVIQINQLSDQLRGSFQIADEAARWHSSTSARRSPGRHSHVNSIFLCTESKTPCPGIDPDKQRTKLFMYNAVYCHKSKPLP